MGSDKKSRNERLPEAILLEIRMFNNFVWRIDHPDLRNKLMKVSAIDVSKISKKRRNELFVHTALSYLPAKARTILYLRFWKGHSLFEISRILNLPNEFVHKLFNLSLIFLERELRSYVMEPRAVIQEYIKVS